MRALGDPMVQVLLAGVMGGTAAVVVLLLRLGGSSKSQVEYLDKARPDRRVKRLDEAVASNPALRRAVEVTANLASRRGLLGSAERALRAADVPVRPAEFILADVCASIAIPVLTYLFTGSTRATLFMAVLMLGMPALVLRFVVARRQKAFSSQLPDALTSLAGSLRAGRSLGQALEAMSHELPDPIGREFRKVVAEVRLGCTLPDALADASKRIDSDDFRWTVIAVQIQAEVGGNLAELLDQVASTMRERSRMKGEVKALTAEGRASALMLVIMVPALALAMWAMNPSYMKPLFSTSTGHVMLGISGVMIAGGYLWMSKMARVDV